MVIFQVGAQNIDIDFGENGITILDQFDDPGFELYPILDSNNRLLIAGIPAQSFMNSEIFVTRLDAEGNVDPDFGIDGYAQYDLGSGFTSITDFIQLENGNIVVAGTSFQDGWLVMFDDQGDLVEEFGDNGYFDTQVGADNNRLLIHQAGDRIFCIHKETIAGIAYLATSYFNMDGTYDISYGVNGTIVYEDFQFSSFGEISWHLGSGEELLGAYFSVFRLNGEEGSFVTNISTDGVLNTSFADEGVYQLTGADFIYDIALDFNNELIIAARSDANFIIQKLDQDGGFVTEFGDNGTYTGSWSLPLGSIERIAPLADGGFLLSGNMDDIAVGKSVVQKYDSDGVADSEVGEIIYDQLPISARDMLHADNGDIYIFGFTIGEMLNVDQLFVIKYKSDYTDVIDLDDLDITLTPNPSQIPEWTFVGENIQIERASLINLTGNSHTELIVEQNKIYSSQNIIPGLYVLSAQTKNGGYINRKVFLLNSN